MSETTTLSPLQIQASLPRRFVLGVILTVLLSLAAFYLLMRPAANEIGLMAVFLSITALVSVLAGYGAYRLGWMYRSPTIRWTLLGGYALASLLTFLNVWVTARLMFASQHDLLLATILLLFAGGIAMVLGYFFSGALSDRIRLLDRAARDVARGKLDVRLPLTGQDELGELARAFNEMAGQLEAAAQKQRQLENLRRDLIAWASHDLQTPLASIQAMVEALADGVVEEPETVQRYLRTCQREIRYLSNLIDDLFQMAQLDAGGLPLNLELGYLSDLVSDTLESFSELASRQGVALQGNVDAGIKLLHMDVQRIGRVFNNLVGNAIRHTGPGGLVEVRAAPISGGVKVEIRDNGEGIQPEDLPYVFDRFYRGEKSRNRDTGGSGLGLAISRGIVEAHGGEISVESAPGQWTRFTFTLKSQASHETPGAESRH